MNPTELAHWRYRVKALGPRVERFEKWAKETRHDAKRRPDSPDFKKITEDAETVLATTKWLLEEARYMCELGAITEPNPAECHRIRPSPSTTRKTKTVNTDFGDEVFWDDTPATMQGDAGPEYYRHKYLLDLVKWASQYEGDPYLRSRDAETVLREFIEVHGRFPR